MAGCALVGGETAEMPACTQKEIMTKAGFAVGIVEKDLMIDQSRVSSNDVLIGIHLIWSTFKWLFFNP